MPRARNPNRDKAKELYLESKGKRPLVDIAKELDVSPGDIRKWKSMDKWVNELPSRYRKEDTSAEKNVPKTDKSVPKAKNNKSAKEGNVPKGKEDAPKRKRGAPLGNKNSVGHKGGAPKGNKRTLKHGGYSKIFWDSLDDEEREFLAMMTEVDEEQILIEEIQLFSIRERRIMRAINMYKTDPEYKKGLYIAGVDSRKTKRVFEGSAEEKEKQKAVYEVLEESGQVVPGVEVQTNTRTEATANLIARLERELTSIQSQKSRAIASLNQIRKNKFEQDVQMQKLPFELEQMDANIERTDALTNKLLGSDNVLEDLSETDKMLYGEDGDADADTV